MSSLKRVLVVMVCIAALAVAAAIAADESSKTSAGEQAKEANQPMGVFLAEAFVVEVPTEQLYAAGVDPISAGGKSATTEVLSKCLAAKTARVTAGLKTLAIEQEGADLHDSRKAWLPNKGNKENVAWTSYDAGTSLSLRFGRTSRGGAVVAFKFGQSMPVQKADEPVTIRNLNWEGTTLVRDDGTPTIVASQLDGDNAIFLVMCAKRVDLGTM